MFAKMVSSAHSRTDSTRIFLILTIKLLAGGVGETTVENGAKNAAKNDTKRTDFFAEFSVSVCFFCSKNGKRH